MDTNKIIPNKFITPVAILLFVVGAVYLGVLTWNAVKAHNYIGVSEKQQHTISFQGSGEVTVAPDMAKLSLGHNITKASVEEAQKINTEKINNTISKLKDDFNIEDKDIKTTNYSIRPQYDYIDGNRELQGYEVNQNIEVKIRELDKIKDILALAGETELNQVGSLQFDIENKDELKKEAREKAIKEAKEKAHNLADTLGVNLGKVVDFQENTRNATPGPVYEQEKVMGRGGSDASAPDVESGSQKIEMNVNLSYEIL